MVVGAPVAEAAVEREARSDGDADAVVVARPVFVAAAAVSDGVCEELGESDAHALKLTVNDSPSELLTTADAVPVSEGAAAVGDGDVELRGDVEGAALALAVVEMLGDSVGAALAPVVADEAGVADAAGVALPERDDTKEVDGAGETVGVDDGALLADAQADALLLRDGPGDADASAVRVDDVLGEPHALGGNVAAGETLSAAVSPLLALARGVCEPDGESRAERDARTDTLAARVGESEMLEQAVALADAPALDDGALGVGAPECDGEPQADGTADALGDAVAAPLSEADAVALSLAPAVAVGGAECDAERVAGAAALAVTRSTDADPCGLPDCVAV